jgi:hypothetical protein
MAADFIIGMYTSSMASSAEPVGWQTSGLPAGAGGVWRVFIGFGPGRLRWRRAGRHRPARCPAKALQYRAVAANQNFSKFHSTSPACLGKQLYWPGFSTKSLAAGKVALGWAAISRA